MYMNVEIQTWLTVPKLVTPFMAIQCLRMLNLQVHSVVNSRDIHPSGPEVGQGQKVINQLLANEHSNPKKSYKA